MVNTKHTEVSGIIHNGFKKVGDGVWKKVSKDYNMTKEHETASKELSERNNPNKAQSDIDYRDSQEHEYQSDKLDNKDYSDKDVACI